jgi:hypothetical protein
VYTNATRKKSTRKIHQLHVFKHHIKNKRPKGWLEAVNQRKTDNALTKRNKWSGQTIIEQQKPEVNKGASEWSAVGGLLVTPVVLNLLTTSVGKSSIKKEPVYDYDKWDLYKVICDTYTL